MNRIRYKETKDGILKSIKDLKSDTTGATYKVKLDTKECTYIITNINSERTYRGGEGITNLHVLKRNVKKHLEKLGVSFSREIRDNSNRISGVNCSYTKEDLNTIQEQ